MLLKNTDRATASGWVSFPSIVLIRGKKGLDKEIGVMVLRLLLGLATKIFSSLGI
jgi:hypothetical protein